MAAVFDIVELTRTLIRCPSVTPTDAGALDVLQRVLEGLGFVCYRLPFGVDGPDITLPETSPVTFDPQNPQK